MASDRRLARRAAAGDPEAFAAIFRRYQQDLYRFCVGILREPQDAEDAVQNTMIRAMRALPGERREMQLKPWLYRIAHNEAVELRRRERPVEPLAPTVEEGAATEELVERDAKLKALLADIADLPERQRAALVMREVNGLGFGEIGDALGTSPGAVRQALYEARRGLSQMELGRDMDCEAAMRQVSDAEGRPRRRGVRAHLRACAGCRRFQAELRGRTGSLASIAPLPGLAVVGLLQGALGGSGAGGATAAGGVGALADAGAGALTGAGVSGAGSAGALAGAGVSGAVKAGVGLLAAIAVGTAAGDHGALLRHAEHSPRVAERGYAAGHSSAERGPMAARDFEGGAAGGKVVWRHEARHAVADHSDAVDRAPVDRAGGRVTPSRTVGVGDQTEAAPRSADLGDRTEASSRSADLGDRTEAPPRSAGVGDQTVAVGVGGLGADATGPTAVPVADVSSPAPTPVPSSIAATKAASAGKAPQGSAPAPQPSPQTAADPSVHGEAAPAEPVVASIGKEQLGGTPAAAAPGTAAPAPPAAAPTPETSEPLQEAPRPAAVAAAEPGNGHGPAKGHAKQIEAAE